MRTTLQEDFRQSGKRFGSDPAAERHLEACRSDLLFADRYEPERLRELLPGIEFQRAISVVEAISAKTEDRMMYDQRLKAQRDYQWGLDSAREQGRQEGQKEGREEGRQEGEFLGKIRILQELLGDEPSSPEDLDERTIGELSEILADLQQRLRSRES